METILFPFDKPRESQKELVNEVYECIRSKGLLIVHAPTGLGKTAASLAPAISAVPENGVVFFLTSRHTQHAIAVKTLQMINKKHGKEIRCLDIIGKKWMCLQSGALKLTSSEFPDFCKRLREAGQCEYYNKARKKNQATTATKKLSDNLLLVPVTTDTTIERSKHTGLCPYEVSIEMAKNANAIIADYNYVFNASIRDSFLAKTGIKMSNAIVIIDEAHNLPSRLREMATSRISNYSVKRAMSECNKFGHEDALDFLKELQGALDQLAKGMKTAWNAAEKLIAKAELKMDDIDEAAAELEFAGEEIRAKQDKSATHSISEFLDAWTGQDEGYARILNTEGDKITLSYRCLDPSLISADVLKSSMSTVMMSATLNPTAMYRDLLGFPGDAKCCEFKSPFAKENRLCMIVPESTTKYAKRSEAEYDKIARILTNMIATIPGNTALFFPSYDLRNTICERMDLKGRSVLMEQPGMAKEEKTKIMSRLQGGKKRVFMGVASGSFAEGIDLPGVLSGVIVVGVPLQKPDLETQELIKYYDKRFGRGWDYGYLYPAITKCIQSAGRCIRSETDRGVVVFLDERFAWNSYLNCFPADMDVKVSRDYDKEIKRFFGK